LVKAAGRRNLNEGIDYSIRKKSVRPTSKDPIQKTYRAGLIVCKEGRKIQ